MKTTVSQGGSGPIVCFYEDRLDSYPGVKLAVLSLARHAPELRVVLMCPTPDAEFSAWVGQQPNVISLLVRAVPATGWNIKPTVLLEMLRSHSEVLWMDSDIIVTGDIRKYFAGLPPNVVVATEETYWGQQQGGNSRTVEWGLEVARPLPCTVNSGVIRVTRHHEGMLQAWQTMLKHPTYVLAQSKPWYERPIHMIGDQEALTGLLGSKDFVHLPVRLLRRGAEIAQCFGPAGFTPGERVRALLGEGPFMIHAMGPKPWLRQLKAPKMLGTRPRVAALRSWYEYLALDISPYCVAARDYGSDGGIDVGWAWPRSVIGKIMSALGGRRPPGPGFALALFDHLGRWFRRRLNMGRYSENLEYVLKERPF